MWRGEKSLSFKSSKLSGRKLSKYTMLLPVNSKLCEDGGRYMCILCDLVTFAGHEASIDFIGSRFSEINIEEEERRKVEKRR